MVVPATWGLRHQGGRWPPFRLWLPLSWPDALTGDPFSLTPYWLSPPALPHPVLCVLSFPFELTCPPQVWESRTVVLEKASTCQVLDVAGTQTRFAFPGPPAEARMQ